MRQNTFVTACVAVLVLTVGEAAAAEEAAFWKAGVAKVRITPQGPYFVAGYSGEKRIASEKLHDLWIKVLALEDAQGRRGALIACDICGFDRVSYEAVCAGLKDRCGLQPSQIILNFTHTCYFVAVWTKGLTGVHASQRREEPLLAATARTYQLLQKVAAEFQLDLDTDQPTCLVKQLGDRHLRGSAVQ